MEGHSDSESVSNDDTREQKERCWASCDVSVFVVEIESVVIKVQSLDSTESSAEMSEMVELPVLSESLSSVLDVSLGTSPFEGG